MQEINKKNKSDRNKNQVSREKSDSPEIICPVCNRNTVIIWVHGHYQCQKCKNVFISCCDGSQIE